MDTMSLMSQLTKNIVELDEEILKREKELEIEPEVEKRIEQMSVLHGLRLARLIIKQGV